HLATLDRAALLEQAGVDEATFERFVELYAGASTAVLVWSMGITQHTSGVAGVQAIVNVGLARGNVGRDGAGLMPIRGHSGVQGGAEMGAYATAFPGGEPIDAHHAELWRERWGFDVPAHPGLTAPEMLEAAERDEIDVLFVDGSNLLEIMPDPPRVGAALGRVPLRVHQDIVLTSQMFVEGDDVILLPAATRYEQEGGGTSTTTERQIAFSPQVAEPLGEARSEWRIFAELASRVRPDLAGRFRWRDNLALRTEIGDAVQYGGRHLCPGGRFPTPSGRARFTVLELAPTALGSGEWYVSTRRGKQFNSMILATTDPLTGATRDAVYIDSHDAGVLGVADGDEVTLTSAAGTFTGRAKLVRLPTRTLQVHWPEGNVLLAGGAAHRDPQSRVPDYNTVVRLDVTSEVGP
ncbi:MAG TPA: molybdopterin-dependent oxidoreductase, partial [Ilumatobacteraceae bacterium]|nr:molybdopterin-dependent oxidoreductase [Ilumatobacteraceae bacterium]